jgi:hypothetical protein
MTDTTLIIAVVVVAAIGILIYLYMTKKLPFNTSTPASPSPSS